jgi:hypothetical protein
MARIPIALWAAVALLAAAGGAAEEKAPVPKDNPAAAYQLAWTDEIRWGNAVSIADMKGSSVEERFAAAQEALGKEGGVVYVPAGSYALKESLKLKNSGDAAVSNNEGYGSSGKE